jgi:hypothetical protein
MTDDRHLFEAHLNRRTVLMTGLGGAAAVVAGVQPAQADSTTATGKHVDRPTKIPPVEGLHLQFGSDASSAAVVSWHTLQPVSHARVLLGTERGYRRSVAASTRTYTDAKSGQQVYAHHTHLSGLSAGSDYVFLATHHGAQPEAGSLRTAPRGRSGGFTFTSFGDQGTPTVGKKYEPPVGVTLPSLPWVNDNLGSPAAGDTTAGVERLRPLFHLFNGDLCYANLAQDRVRTWWDFWDNNTRSARHRPWMPSAGNHENELGNGPIGYAAYQTYFEVPETAGQTDVTHGLWYSFTAGAVRVISIANDDVTYQDGGNSYVRGYSHGAQRAWLESALRSARQDRRIDWIVICMHQVAISTADKFNGADLGIREEWLPLFDKYGVDLVVCGHEHHYERSHPLRGHENNPTITPKPAQTDTSVIDTTRGTVHMIIGGGGTSAPSNQLFFTPPACRVITAVGEPNPATGKRPPIYVQEPAPWSAVRNAANSYGFAAFTVDPGHRGGHTTMTVTYYDVTGLGGELSAFETFELRRPRRDR